MERGTFNCEACGDTFNSEQELQQHIRSAHSANGVDVDEATVQATDDDEEAVA